MQIITSINELRATLSASESPIGLVPTMGFLHDGHLALMQEARKHNKTVVASIFVNPTQFGPNEDFDKYPRDIARDEALLTQAGVDILFYPSVQEMYPAGAATTIHVTGVSEGFCGASRPVHFDGVALVVTKLFNIVSPQNAYFGLKDYQQFQVIRRFVKDLNIDVKLTGVPIVREADGLALSSRNVYLSADERRSALSLSASFELITRLLAEKKPLDEIKKAAIDFIHSHPHTAVEYLDFADPDSLQLVHSGEAHFVCLMAVRVGKTRLIDNKLFSEVSYI
ncbi:MAG: pantoate--beta-alanine ligase [Deferribacteraceae bacterium]|jgi:pantoate--beta-alanine ligase|nr:pantoate--beta-alanine ligase [Deferribacteraceae bacterium]